MKIEQDDLRIGLTMAVLRRARKGAGSRLLGDQLDRAQTIYLHDLVGSCIPGFWMEAPLLGTPGFDFHVYYDRDDLQLGDQFAPGNGYGYQPLFDWFWHTETGGVGLGLAHDLRADPDGAPAVYVNTNHRPLDDNAGFFQAAGHPELASAAEALIGRLPEDYRTWYLGVFGNRAGTPARIGSFLPERARQVCASDPRLFARELADVGFNACSDAMLQQLHELANVPLDWEVQFDVYGDGHVGDTLSISLCLPLAQTTRFADFFANDGLGGQAMHVMEGWGIADDRWTLIPQACFARAIRLPGYLDGHLLHCHPSFLKAKWIAGEAQPAKVYLQCSARLAGSTASVTSST